MGRHSAPAPTDQARDRAGSRSIAPSTLPVITVAMLRSAEPTAPAAPRAASDQRQPKRVRQPTAIPFDVIAPTGSALQLRETRPVPIARLPRVETLRLVAPDLGAQSLSTGPVTVHARPAVHRTARPARIAVALAAVAILGAVSVQLSTQRSVADATDASFIGRSGAVSTSAGRASATGSVTRVPSTVAAPPGTPARSASATALASRPSGSRTARASAASSSPQALSSSNALSLRSALTGGRDLAAGLFRFSDFGSDLLGMDLTGRLTGAGSASTVLEMTPMSSSRRSDVPTKAWATNQLSLIRISQATVVSGFTLQGTDQGHLYNGLRISRSTNPRISDVRVISIPGDDDIPPGETFGINDFHTTGADYSDVEVDGSGISGATFGANNSKDVSISDSSFHDAGHSNGATFWQTQNVTVTDTSSVDNKDAAFNFERVSGTVLLDHVTMHGNGLSDLRIDSDKSSAVYRIVDPVLDGKKLTIVMTPTYMGHKNLQKKSDVHVIVNGVDRTDELVTWVDHF